MAQLRSRRARELAARSPGAGEAIAAFVAAMPELSDDQVAIVRRALPQPDLASLLARLRQARLTRDQR